jgi:hypothetical protein
MCNNTFARLGRHVINRLASREDCLHKAKADPASRFVLPPDNVTSCIRCLDPLAHAHSHPSRVSWTCCF